MNNRNNAQSSNGNLFYVGKIKNLTPLNYCYENNDPEQYLLMPSSMRDELLNNYVERSKELITKKPMCEIVSTQIQNNKTNSNIS
jgi:hypothetical protein